MTDLLTEQEHEALALTADLTNSLARIVGNGPTRSADLDRLRDHIHGIQQTILAQAAARAYPKKYRLLGETLSGPDR